MEECQRYDTETAQQSCIEYFAQQDVLGLGVLALLFVVIAACVMTAIIRST